MKKWFHIFYISAFAALLFTACKKDETKLVYDGGTAPVLSASASDLTLVQADSLNNAVTFSWTDPNYTVSSNKSSLNVNYALEIDTAGGNFAKDITVNVVNALQQSYNVRDFNAMLIKFGLKAGKTYTLNVRISSALYWAPSKYVSNVLTITVTPYSVKPTPVIPVPANLYIVGDATPGGWNNPVPVPSQQLTPIDEFTYGIVIQLTGGAHYLFLPTNGDWGHKYACPDKTDPANQTEGNLVVDGGDDIPAPPSSGLYKIIVNFVTGKYYVTPATAADLPPANLFIVGDATDGGWNNPVPVPDQQFTQTSSCGFDITVHLNGTGLHYLLLPVNGDWGHKYACNDKTDPAAKDGGPLKVDSGDDIPAPDADGMYKIHVEFVTKTYAVTQ